MLTVHEVTEIFYLSDEFCKEFAMSYKNHLLETNDGKTHRNKPNRLFDSEVMTILIAFHLSGMRNLKHFYLYYVCKDMNEEFPSLVSYTRFVELSFVITQGNVDDRVPLSIESFIRNIAGKLYADRGYVSRKLADLLFVDGIHLVARMRNNMKGG